MAETEPVSSVETTPSLAHLPSEILAQIFKYFNVEDSGPHHAYPEGVWTLLSLCLCSKRLRANAEVILYSTIHQSDAFQDVKLLRSILKRPGLAQYVKHLHLDIILEDADRRTVRDDPIHFRHAELSKLLEIIESFPSVDKSGMFKEVLSAYGDATAAVLLTLLPRLQTLSVWFGGSTPSRHLHHISLYGSDSIGVNHDSYISEVLHDVLTNQDNPDFTSSIANLKALRLGYARPHISDSGSSSFPEYSHQLNQFCGLKSIKKLILGQYVMHMNEKHSSQSIVPHVELTVDYVRCDTLALFISQFSNLESFTLQTSDCDSKNMATALASSKSTLKSLSLKVPMGNTNVPLQSFGTFDRLESLDVPGDLTRYGHKCTTTEHLKASFLSLFPPRIRSLTLRQATLDDMVFAVLLLQAKKQRFPGLEALRFVMNVRDFETTSAAWIGKYQYFRRFEIEFGVKMAIENDISGLEYDLTTTFKTEGPEEQTSRIRISLVDSDAEMKDWMSVHN